MELVAEQSGKSNFINMIMGTIIQFPGRTEPVRQDVDDFYEQELSKTFIEDFVDKVGHGLVNELHNNGYDVDDDEFDGDLGEDDEELPMITTTFVLSKNVPPVVPQEATPSPQRMNQAPVPQKNQEPPENMSRRGTSQGASSQAKSQIPSINRNMGSR